MQGVHQGDPTLHDVPLWVTGDRICHFIGIISLTSMACHKKYYTSIDHYMNLESFRKADLLCLNLYCSQRACKLELVSHLRTHFYLFLLRLLHKRLVL